MDKQRLDNIVAALNTKGVTLPCPRCGKRKFSVIGESSILIQDDPNTYSIGGPGIPTAIVACDNCGYVTQHSTVRLGLVQGTTL